MTADQRKALAKALLIDVFYIDEDEANEPYNSEWNKQKEAHLATLIAAHDTPPQGVPDGK